MKRFPNPRTALLLAIGHFIFFRFLDGSSAEHRQLEQSEVTAISLLITTAFKACIVTSVSISFAQHLWHLVRVKSLRITRIEQLFCIRSNPLELARLKAVLEAPLLFLMAVMIWLIPIAIIYPPSALIVVSTPYSYVRAVDTSILNPPLPLNFDLLHPEKTPYSSLAIINDAFIASRAGDGDMFDRYNGDVASITYKYM